MPDQVQRHTPARTRSLRDVIAAVGVTVCALQLLACGGSGPEIVAGTMPSGGTFTGVYFSPQYGEMNVIQNGSAVIGEYKQDERTGKIQGEASGDLMKFEWVERKALVSNRAQESRGHGYFRYKIDKGNGDHVLQGEWGIGDGMTGSPWNAVKSKRKQPKLSHDKTSGGDSSEEESDETPSKSDDEGSSDDLF